MEASKMNEKQSNQNPEKQAEEAQMEAARVAAQALDETFGAGTAWTLSGDIDKTVGHAETHAGQVLHEPRMVVEGVGLQAYGTGEHIEGRLEHDQAAQRAEIEKAIAALKAEFAKLKAEFDHTTGEARTNIQSKMDSARARQQGIVSRIQIELKQAQKNRDAKIAALEQQAAQAEAQAEGEAKANLAASIEQVRQDYKQDAADLDKMLEQAEDALKG